MGERSLCGNVRQYGYLCDIRGAMLRIAFILGWSSPEDADVLSENNIIVTLVSVENALAFSEKASKPVRVHIKLDTGMGRVGLDASDTEHCASDIAKIAVERRVSSLNTRVSDRTEEYQGAPECCGCRNRR